MLVLGKYKGKEFFFFLLFFFNHLVDSASIFSWSFPDKS